MAAALPPLHGNQAKASDPTAQVELSASAGTGKTQVLSARVFRLLLRGVKPEAILCLTFTKAGAAEMKERIHHRLALWATMDDVALAEDLRNLGENFSPPARDQARSLFAKLLDAPGAGLRILTIHSFCQSLLSAFPVEAGLLPGFRTMDDRDKARIAGQAFGGLADEACRDASLSAALGSFLKRAGTSRYAERLAMAADHPESYLNLPIGEGLKASVIEAISDWPDPEDELRERLSDGGFDGAGLVDLLAQLRAGKTKAGTPSHDCTKVVAQLAPWLDGSFEDRLKLLAPLAHQLGLSKWRAYVAFDDIDAVADWMAETGNLAALVATHIPRIIEDLTVLRAYARRHMALTQTSGLIDFNDQIKRTAALLARQDIGLWILYKLDQAIDHILVDESQDTNRTQWKIVRALADEFFDGEGASREIVRTIFMVGDYKQSIFGFQGTDPDEFARAAAIFRRAAEAVDQEMLSLDLAESWRSSQPILDVTDQVIAALGHTNMGLPKAPERHVSAKKGWGTVTLLPPISPSDLEVSGSSGEDDDEGESPLSSAEREWAAVLARQIAGWTTGSNRLHLRNEDRPAEPGDVMVLLRSRTKIAAPLVASLHRAGVPVAGLDRMTLTDQIAVQDLLSAIRFALQPEDDLTVAELLLSPLVGWDEERLAGYATARANKSLWEYLGDDKPSALKAILAKADRMSPFEFLEYILSDPAIAARRSLIARLGEEVRDPINELLNAALTYGATEAATLQGFLSWLMAQESQLKRDASKRENKVRIMTVHGAKGLQAPIVVLADTLNDPEANKKEQPVELSIAGSAVLVMAGVGAGRPEIINQQLADKKARELQEYHRLLYVGMTRAEEYLFVGGAKGKAQEKSGVKPHIWYDQISRAVVALSGEDRGPEGMVLNRHDPPPAGRKSGGKKSEKQSEERWAGPLPEWLRAPAPEEAVPPRPLAPSRLTQEDDATNPPPDPVRAAAIRRGILLHGLFERLPAVAAQHRRVVAERWLSKSSGVDDPQERASLNADVMAILDDPSFAHLFSPQSLAEVPIAGVVSGQVIAGAMDRLLVEHDQIIIIDYKTGRSVPADADRVPKSYVVQMAAYAAILAQSYPNRPITAALLYTAGPKLILLSPEQLEAHKPGYQIA
jgi:ATP-dependent helicase/nuclease subunit A